MSAIIEQVIDDSAQQHRIHACQHRLLRLQLNIEVFVQNTLLFNTAEDALVQVLIVIDF